MSARKRNYGARRGQRGFTIIELMIVITIIMILMAIAAGKYQQSLLRARESALLSDLSTMRTAIDQFTIDKSAAPQSLDDLVQAGYMRQIPLDPFTHEADWTTESSSDLFTPEQLSGGINSVHSRSNEVSPFTNTPYSSW